MRRSWRKAVVLSAALAGGLAGCNRLPWSGRAEAVRHVAACAHAQAADIQVTYVGDADVCGVFDAGAAGRPKSPAPFIFFRTPRPSPANTFGPDYVDFDLNRALPSAAMRDANVALLVSACAVPQEWRQVCEARATDRPSYCRLMAVRGVRTLAVFTDSCGPS